MGDLPTTGSTPDITRRLRAALPLHWFADDAPVLGAVLAGFSDGWARLYDMLQTVRRQSRIGSAEGDMLDLIAADFFGARLVRRIGQGDAGFRAAILRELLRERGTRQALASALTDLTGNAPQIFEPSRPADTGAWGRALGYGVAGGWGSLALPFQCFVRVRRPSGQGIGGVEGYESLWPGQPIAARAACSRTSTATRVDSLATLREVGPGVPRVDFSTGVGRVLQEAASANQVHNPRAEGATAGTIGGAGVPPAYWSVTSPTGVTAWVIGSGTEAGMPYLDVRWQGTVSAVGAGVRCSFDQPVGIAASAGQTWTASVYARLMAGSLAGSWPQLTILEADSLGRYVTASASNLTPSSAPLLGQRVSTTRTLNGSGTANVYSQFYLPTPVGQVLDFTLRFGAPQLEQAAAASSVMLPPAGSPGVAVRSGETIGITVTLPGGYGAGAIEWASLAMVQGQVTDGDIYDAAARSMPAAAIAWTAISS